MKKSIFLIFLLSLIFLIIFLIVINVYNSKTCNDGTSNKECSTLKSFFCEEGKLVKNIKKCGFENQDYYKNLQKTKKEEVFNYYFNGKNNKINLTLYKEVHDYLYNLSKSFNFKKENNFSRQNLKLKRINNSVQDFFINNLVAKIINNGKTKKDQLRIAVSLVQNIPYNRTKNKIYFFGVKINRPEYPYEVLYNHQGVCQGKSDLLALLLKKLGYDVVIFHFEKENHDAVGVKCPLKYSFNGTGYCFIETTFPSIISDSEIIYEDGLILKSKPDIIKISQGDSLGYGMYEYLDAKRLNKINNKILQNKYLNPIDRFYLNRLKEKYNLYYLYS